MCLQEEQRRVRPHGTQLLSFPQGAKIVKKKDIESREEIEVRD